MEKVMPCDQPYVIFKDFLNSIMENRTWPTRTHAFVTVKNGGITRTRYFKNISIGTPATPKGKHAEEEIVDKCLKDLPENTDVKIVINYSPCKKCSDLINQFYMEKSPNIKLEIVFAGLYNIDRKVPHPSGNPQKKLFLEDPNKCTSIENIDGLKELSKNVNLRNFSLKDWKDIWETLRLDGLLEAERSTMWEFVLEETRYTSKFSNEEEMIKTRLRNDECVKVELEIMLGKFESDKHVQDLMDFFKQGKFESDKHVEDLMGFFKQVTPSPVPPSPVTPSAVTPSAVTPSAVTPSPVTPSPVPPSPGAEAVLDEKLKGMKLNEGQETPKTEV